MRFPSSFSFAPQPLSPAESRLMRGLETWLAENDYLFLVQERSVTIALEAGSLFVSLAQVGARESRFTTALLLENLPTEVNGAAVLAAAREYAEDLTVVERLGGHPMLISSFTIPSSSISDFAMPFQAFVTRATTFVRQVFGVAGELPAFRRPCASAPGDELPKLATGQPQQCLYFLPLPQGHGSLRPIFG